MNWTCKFCKKQLMLKNKYTKSGHLATCSEFKNYKNIVLTKKYLIGEYIDNMKSAIELAKLHQLESATVILNLLRLYKIPTRNIKESCNKFRQYKYQQTCLRNFGVPHNFLISGSFDRRKKLWISKYGVDNPRKSSEIKKKIINNGLETKYKLGLAIRPELKTDWEIYKSQVMKITNKYYKKYKQRINPNNVTRKRNEYHLDHMYSIYSGFNNNVPPKIISHPANLQMLLESINISKSNKNKITLQELYRRIKQYETIRN